MEIPENNSLIDFVIGESVAWLYCVMYTHYIHTLKYGL